MFCPFSGAAHEVPGLSDRWPRAGMLSYHRALEQLQDALSARADELRLAARRRYIAAKASTMRSSDALATRAIGHAVSAGAGVASALGTKATRFTLLASAAEEEKPKPAKATKEDLKTPFSGVYAEDKR